MKIADRIHLVGSGRNGLSLTDPIDCHVYLLDGGSECALIDAGGGRDADGTVAHIKSDGFDTSRVRHLFLTHAHADHAAGAAGLRERLDLHVHASPEVAASVRSGDERFSSLGVARQAGVYPEDFTLDPCPVDVALADDQVVRVGDLSVRAITTPGHSAGHLSFVLTHGGATSVFCGDSFFFGGRILLQHIWDCSVQQSIVSVQRLASLDVDGLYPGHNTFCVRNGRRQFEPALRAIAALLPPPQMS